MIENPLAPPAAVARARPNGRIPFGFGPRFFVAILLGFGWLIPAWWFPRMIAAMFLWDGVFVAAWLWDFLQLPSPSQLELRRIWRTRPALACASSIAIEVTNSGRITIRARITDETPLTLRTEPANVELRARAGATAPVSYTHLTEEMQSIEHVAAHRSWQEWIRAARLAADGGNFREAVHSSYWAGVTYIEDLGVVAPDRSRTPREYLRLIEESSGYLPSERAKRRDSLAALTSRLERIWYGLRPARVEDFQDCMHQVEELGCRLP